jgi:hypothetical protein
MNSFFDSTQYKNWIKTKEEIQKITLSKLYAIDKRINDVNNIVKKEDEIKVEAIKNKQSETSQTKIHRYINPKIVLLYLKDEKFLLIYYSKRFIKIMNSQKDENRSTNLKNTVVSYFRRFFLKKSILDYYAGFLFPSALRLGAKLCSINYIKDDYLNIFPMIENNWDKLNEYEYHLCYILEYDFYVYNPYQALLGLIHTLEQKGFFLTQSKDNYINKDDFTKDCMSIIDNMYLTDIIFLYTYSEIALASIFIQSEYKNIKINNIAEKLDLDKSLNIKNFIDNQVKDMKQMLDEIPKYESQSEEDTKIKEIDRNVRHFLRNFPLYQTQLDNERANLKNKMKKFDENFKQFEKPKEKK